MKINSYSPKHYSNYNKYACKPSFGTSGRFYTSQYGIEMGTMTSPFRSDINWQKFTEYLINHFKDKNKVNLIQFASSDGSEAYSQIIALMEKGKGENLEKFFPILAYDVDEEIVRVANSGFLNINPENMKNINHNCTDYTRYFKKSSQKLKINNNFYDLFKKNYSTYEVSDHVRKNVIFNHADMFDILINLEDKSNTVLMCRNVLGYFSDRVIKNTVEMVARKLNENSLFIIGKLDTESNIKYYLKNNNFKEIMQNIFLKTV